MTSKISRQLDVKLVTLYLTVIQLSIFHSNTCKLTNKLLSQILKHSGLVLKQQPPYPTLRILIIKPLVKKRLSQEEPQKLRPQHDHDRPINYGYVFDVSGELASQPVAQRDAAAMQAAENMALGKTQRGGPAAVMQSAAEANERAGFTSHSTATHIARDQGVTVSESTVADGNRIITEAIGDQVLAQYATPEVPTRASGAALGRDQSTIGEALETTALSAGDKAVDQSDAAAIYAAEARASATNEIKPGGSGSRAQSAATQNERTTFFSDKITISDVSGDATTKLSDDKPVTREDAEGIISPEIRNKPDMRTTPGGVASSMAAAARLNQSK